MINAKTPINWHNIPKKSLIRAQKYAENMQHSSFLKSKISNDRFEKSIKIYNDQIVGKLAEEYAAYVLFQLGWNKMEINYGVRTYNERKLLGHDADLVDGYYRFHVKSYRSSSKHDESYVFQCNDPLIGGKYDEYDYFAAVIIDLQSHRAAMRGIYQWSEIYNPSIIRGLANGNPKKRAIYAADLLPEKSIIYNLPQNINKSNLSGNSIGNQ